MLMVRLVGVLFSCDYCIIIVDFDNLPVALLKRKNKYRKFHGLRVDNFALHINE